MYIIYISKYLRGDPCVVLPEEEQAQEGAEYGEEIAEPLIPGHVVV